MYDVAIVGAGIVGLATAYRLLEKNSHLSVVVIEKEPQIAAHQTSHNSGVIHSGIYYRPGSLKALNCVRGVQMLINFAQKYNIPHDICGKIIVATNEDELPLLQHIYDRGLRNGLDQIKKISAEEARTIEPYVNCKAAIFVPYAGIICYKSVAETLAKIIKQNNGSLLLGCKVNKITASSRKIHIDTSRETLRASFLINCAGLYADKLAQFTHPHLPIQIVPFRGEYYQLKKEKEYLVRNLIYPVPNPEFPFLGVHFTRMISGGIEAGPNAVLAFRREGYRKTDFHCTEFAETLFFPGFLRMSTRYWKTGLLEMCRSLSKSFFTKTLQKLIPAIQEDDLVPAGTGVRAQAVDRSGRLIDDFYILESSRVIHVCNAPSPAATSALSIGLTIAEKALQQMS